ncbi:hypothetical protein EXIGLDRAFT_720079 [Exidia glandulosa HHB12029]|uniref:Uncharacterized protein n=1 Tax=Exidia glandulosa HHB12029 TaxID=1314781 RepID=A0A165GN28_EXIGL|nr:hypothetical protein EXIGLDRAFT_720079 [Exidia glandulosa HHB12029]
MSNRQYSSQQLNNGGRSSSDGRQPEPYRSPLMDALNPNAAKTGASDYAFRVLRPNGTEAVEFLTPAQQTSRIRGDPRYSGHRQILTPRPSTQQTPNAGQFAQQVQDYSQLGSSSSHGHMPASAPSVSRYGVPASSSSPAPALSAPQSAESNPSDFLFTCASCGDRAWPNKEALAHHRVNAHGGRRCSIPGCTRVYTGRHKDKDMRHHERNDH